MKLRAFTPLRPPRELASTVASPPYDVIDSAEARRMAAGNPKSFLHINKPEIDLPETVSLYDDAVYAKAAENFSRFQQMGWLRRDAGPGLYFYRQSFGGHAQTGLVGVCHTEDYENDIIKKHERPRPKTEDDRTRHVSTLRANAGPVFLMVRAPEAFRRLIAEVTAGEPEVDFVSPDGVRHSTWPAPDAESVVAMFAEIPAAYVADGHHRSASASRCARELAAANPHHQGGEDYNWFLSVIFPAEDLQVLPYNRLVADLNGLSPEDFLRAVRGAGFSVRAAESGVAEAPGDIRMFVDGA
jgi:uncharacterized protein (DUF1015 family)